MYADALSAIVINYTCIRRGCLYAVCVGCGVPLTFTKKCTQFFSSDKNIWMRVYSSDANSLWALCFQAKTSSNYIEKRFFFAIFSKCNFCSSSILFHNRYIFDPLPHCCKSFSHIFFLKNRRLYCLFGPHHGTNDGRTECRQVTTLTMATRTNVSELMYACEIIRLVPIYRRRQSAEFLKYIRGLFSTAAVGWGFG